MELAHEVWLDARLWRKGKRKSGYGGGFWFSPRHSKNNGGQELPAVVSPDFAVTQKLDGGMVRSELAVLVCRSTGTK